MPRGGRKKGADSYKIDKRVVPWLKEWCRVAKQPPLELSDFEAIRMLVNINPRLFGRHSADATVHRLYQKMKSGRYGKPVPPRGIPWHWSHLRFQNVKELARSLKSRRNSSKSK
jgi:hypothetical protein